MQGSVTLTVERFYRHLIDKMPAGERLPSERTVMRELGVSRSTVRIVLTKLLGEGLVEPIQGSGYFTRQGAGRPPGGE